MARGKGSFLEYSLIVKNCSKQAGYVCVYQTFPEQKNNANIYSVAWLFKLVRSKTKVLFKWKTDYSFMWFETGAFTPGMTFSASELKQADPNNVNNNSALFSREGGAYFFKDTVEQGQAGVLTITTDNTISSNRASVGVSVSGKTAIVVNVFANTSYQFTVKPTYWIVFGNFEEGQVLDLNNMNQAKEINFSRSSQKQSLRLTTDMKWK